MTKLFEMTCSAGGQARKLSDAEIASNLAGLVDWKVDNNELVKTFTFKNYHETVAFVNASAWISHHEDHHPDIGLHYNRCVVHYSTHDAGGTNDKGGITLNDFICAAKLDRLCTK